MAPLQVSRCVQGVKRTDKNEGFPFRAPLPFHLLRRSRHPLNAVGAPSVWMGALPSLPVVVAGWAPASVRRWPPPVPRWRWPGGREEKLEEVAASVYAKGGRAIAVEADIADPPRSRR